MGDYRSLEVWQKAHELARAVYQDTEHFPKSEVFALTSQLRWAAVSIPSNLAEGSGRNTQKELAHVCRIALGSANELEYQLLLARDLGYHRRWRLYAVGERRRPVEVYAREFHLDTCPV